jgi:hypothetical protein
MVQNNIENSKICAYLCSLIWKDIRKIIINYEVTRKNIWKTFMFIKEEKLKSLFKLDFAYLKKYIKNETGKDLYFKDIGSCLEFLMKNSIPYKIENDYSYIVFTKVEDDVVISEKNIINEKDTVHQFYRYEDGGYAALLPI